MTETSFETIATVGAISCVLTALLLLMAHDLWVQALLPLWRWLRYRTVKISGYWKGLGTNYTPALGEWDEFALTLEQDARDVRGQLMVRHHGAGPSFDLKLPVAGVIADGYLTLNLSPTKKNPGLAASALLKIEAGAALNGLLIYRHPGSDRLDVIDMSVHRAESVRQARALPLIRPASTQAALSTAPMRQ